MVPLKYLIDVRITLEMPLIECEINLILKWSAICSISAGTAATLHYVTRFAITDTKLYLLVVPFSYQDNTKLLKLLKFGFKGTNNWNKYQ